MTPTEKAIGFLRTLTFDGYLSSDEVWLLAKFLNENSDCREVWPGNLLFPMLHMAFADSELSEQEMSFLASAIAAIEQQWLRQRGSHATHEEKRTNIEDALGALELPFMPQLEMLVEIPSSSGEDTYEVSLYDHTCTCPDWSRRSSWPAGHLGRCCKHVATGFNMGGTEYEPWFRAVLDDLLYRGKGTHPGDEWLKLQVGRRKPIIVSGGNGDWHNVFASTANGYERYGYNRSEDRWSYGEAPYAADQIARAVRESFASI